MKTIEKYKLFRLLMFFMLVGMLLLSGCTRYARNVNTLYEPTAPVRGGSGDIYIIIPESQITQSSDIKWVIGKVLDDDNRQIDEVFSPRSPAEIIQSALGQEFFKAGYTVIPVTKRPEKAELVIDLTKTKIELEQISDLVDLKVKCRVLAGMDVLKSGQMIKRLQYESSASKTDIKDRELLARNVMRDALQSVILKAIPDLHTLLKQ